MEMNISSKFSKILLIALIFSILLLASQIAIGQEKVVYIIPIRGDIELGLSRFLQRALKMAQREKADAIILEIDTFGGRVDAATQMKDALMDSDILTIAFVQRGWSAGALIALACDHIVMKPGSSIGAAEPRVGGGITELQPTDEKIVSALREEFRSTAEGNGHPGDIAAAMVDKDIVIEGVIEKGKLLTLAAESALELKVADRKLEKVESILKAYDLEPARQVIVSPNWAEQVSRFVTSPIVSSLLLTLGFLGLIWEFRTPTWGIAGTFGLISLALFFGGHMIAGLAGWESIIIFAVGSFLLALEIFVIPGFGITGISGIIAILLSLFMSFGGNYIEAAYSILSAFLATVIISLLLLRYIPRTKTWSKLVLSTGETAELGFSATPQEEKKRYLGERGRSISMLRPAGVAEINGERIDVVSEGDFIPPYTEIEVIQVSDNRVVVRALLSD